MIHKVNQQKGIALIEFTMTVLVFLIFFIGVIEIARLMFTWNTANEAARQAGRIASICEFSTAQQEIIKNKTQFLINAGGNSSLDGTDWLQFDYYPLGCGESNCQFVRTTVQNVQFSMLIPVYGGSITLPPVTYTTVRELLNNQLGGNPNPICQ
jgi:Flp pilus assembly protein TadG